MGNAMGTTFSTAKPKFYMRTPDLSSPDSHAQVCELISELGNQDFCGIVSLGPLGVGKSSNLNTIASYLSNRLEQEAAAGAGATTLTTACRNHMITYQGRPVKWRWMDTPGDIFSALVEKWKQTTLPETSEGYLTPEEYEQFLDENFLQMLQLHQLGCVMAMISAVELYSQAYPSGHGEHTRLTAPEGSRLYYHLQVLKHLYRHLVQRGLRMICVITKVDLVDADIEEDVSAVQRSLPVHQLRQCISRSTGVPMNQVHPVVNLVEDFEPQSNLPLGHLALFNVRSALRAASHADVKPANPAMVRATRSTTSSATPWETYTQPSSIVGDDGTTGRSYPVGGVSPVLFNGSPIASNAPNTATPGPAEEQSMEQYSPELPR